MVKVILMGPPGSGKGTQASKLASILDVESISSGDLFRSNLSNNTDLGMQAKKFMDKGEYVPDEITINMVMSWVEDPSHDNGFVLDGFPRTLGQAQALENRMINKSAIDRVIFFNVEAPILVERLSGRLICSECQKPYHKLFSPPSTVKICDDCGAALYQRDDDKEDVVVKRLKVYLNETEPVIEYYRSLNILHEINAELSIKEISQAIENVVR
jgi:adenylate kinase